MVTKKNPIADKIRTTRMVYDPPIREAIALNDVDQMKAVLKEAQKVHAGHAASIANLESAIKKLS
jgi:Domain of unknown function (DUF1843)